MQSETKQAVGVMEGISEEISTGTGIAQDAGEALTKIITAVNEATDVSRQIAEEMQVQLRNGERVDRTVSEIAKVAEESAAGTEETAASTEEQTASMEEISASSQELADMAQKLAVIVEKFKV